MRSHTLIFFLLLTLPLALQASPADEARLLRFPDIHQDQIVFVYAGDIWRVSAQGGLAHRLTSDEGLELFPKFSPDGAWIAFSAEYGGNRQVYVMASKGGQPRQLTFYNDVGVMPPRGGFDHQVLDWTPDGKRVLFRANRLPWGPRLGRPYLVPVDGGMEEPLPVPESGPASFSPDGKKLVYTPIAREFRTWKRYRGGQAQDVWIFDLENTEARRITDFRGTDNQPMWIGDTIYFNSDRGGRLNLHAYDLESEEIRRATHHEDFDVLWPSSDARQVVYECGGFLYRFDPASGESLRVPIQVTGDFLHTVPYFDDVRSQITTMGISPTGKRALLAARGEIFTAPAKHGEVRNLTRTPGIREISPSWSPDGAWIAYLSDRSGEYEIYLRPPRSRPGHNGSQGERRVTTDGDIWRFPPRWSPDSKKLVYSDKRQRLRYIEVSSGTPVDVDRGTYNDITTYGWSPDSRFLVYTKLGESRFSSIYVYSMEDGKISQLTDDFTNDTSPVFDPGGRYLYFLSDRDFNLTFSGFEFNYLYTNPTRVYAATLKRDGPALLLPKVDEEEEEREEEKEDPEGQDATDQEGGNRKRSKNRPAGPPESGEAHEEIKVEIDVAGFQDRVMALPGESGNYRALTATDDGVLYLVGDGAAELKRFSVTGEETEVLLTGVGQYAVSHDGKKLLYRQGPKLGIVDLAPGKKVGDGLLDLDDWKLKIDPKAEWRQIFVDAWRITRDWFYDPAIHGLDWQALRELYEPLVDHVAHRADLDHIFGELAGELAAGHSYVNWGDFPRPERVDNGLLGAHIAAHDSGYFRIDRIYPGENWHPDLRSPLTESGVEVDEGDFILAVDGQSTRQVRNFYQLLENRAQTLVTLLVNDSPSLEGAHEIHVRPIAQETRLRYLDWVRSRRQTVDLLSGGRIGYIHLPDTAVQGNLELRKYFYPQAHKEALIIDVRYNGGGFIPDRMIELLGRTQLSYWARRGLAPNPTPGYTHRGPKACLINGYAGSGGDVFPYYFRKLGLGKLIGTRTWGGVIGISGNPGFLDGGSLNLPTFRFFNTEGDWAVENIGVVPDIEVVDRPDLVAAGQDPSLEKAVEVLLQELSESPPGEVEVPSPPTMPR